VHASISYLAAGGGITMVIKALEASGMIRVITSSTEHRSF
jgi:hypothetical protein